MPSVFEELGRLRPGQQDLLVFLKEISAGRVLFFSQPTFPLFRMQSLKLLASLLGHDRSGYPPELVIGQLLEGLNAREDLGRDLALYRSTGRHRVEDLGLQAAGAAFRALPQTLVESFGK